MVISQICFVAVYQGVTSGTTDGRISIGFSSRDDAIILAYSSVSPFDAQLFTQSQNKLIPIFKSYYRSIIVS